MSALRYLLALSLSLIAGFAAGHVLGLGAEVLIGGLGATDHAAMLGMLLLRYGGTFAGGVYGLRLGGRFV